MKTVLALIFLCLLLSACGAPRQFSVLIHMAPEQEKYFREKIVPPFEKKHRCRVDVAVYTETGDLDKSIRALPGRCGLVKAPFEQTRRLVSENLILPLDSAVTPEQRTGLQRKYFLLDLAMVDGKLYYLPRHFETRIVVYLKSRVREAVLRWGDRTDEIDSVLKAYNGSGLPAEYLLEEDPGQWDYYDLFVVGYFWSRDTPGRVAPKIAQGGRRCSGTAQTLVDRIYQLGGEKENVLSMEGDCVADMMEWEALFVKEQIYNPAMWKDSLDSDGVRELFRKGAAYLSFMTQQDCFSLHGNYTPPQPGYVEDPDDLGFSVMPRGVSVELSSDGRVLRQGRRSVSMGGWWWGIPRDAPYPDLSFKLAEWILSPENVIEECGAFGMIPVRKDVLGDISLLFGKGWISDLYEVSFKQLIENRYTTVPLVETYPQLEQIYLDAWYDIAVSGSCGSGKGGGMRDAIRGRLASVYTERAKALKVLETSK